MSPGLGAAGRVAVPPGPRRRVAGRDRRTDSRALPHPPPLPLLLTPPDLPPSLRYLLPGLERLLANGAGGAAFRMLVLVPTRELCEQVREEARALVEESGAGFEVTSLAQAAGGVQLQRQVAAAGQVVVATPGRIAGCIRDGVLAGSVLQNNMEVLVLDEADLLLSYGYEADLEGISPQLSQRCHRMLFGATTSVEVDRIARRILHKPAVIRAEAPAAAGGAGGAGERAVSISPTIEHQVVRCAAKDKMLTAMTLLKMGLVRRKVLIFVHTIDAGFRLKLFLGHFGVQVALLNAELPLNSRHHIIQEFNKGLFDYVIATDSRATSSNAAGPRGGAGADGEGAAPPQGKPSKLDPEYGVVRGIDFKGVNTVLNFDVPKSTEAYVHRVGRTGRAGSSGLALTLAAPEDGPFLEALEALLVEHRGDAEEDAAPVLSAFPRLTRAAVENLRYRGEDVARAVTWSKIKEARAKELRQELINSQRLQAHFEKNPKDLMLLRHDKPVKSAVAAHLKHVPGYLKDKNLVAADSSVGNGRASLSRKNKKRRVNPLRAILDTDQRRKVSDAERKASAKSQGSMLWGKKGGGGKKRRRA